jgi:hypothetical protein
MEKFRRYIGLREIPIRGFNRSFGPNAASSLSRVHCLWRLEAKMSKFSLPLKCGCARDRVRAAARFRTNHALGGIAPGLSICEGRWSGEDTMRGLGEQLSRLRGILVGGHC